MATSAFAHSYHRRVVILTAQLLFVPFLIATLEAEAFDVLGVLGISDEAQLVRLNPSLVLIDLGEGDAEFAALRRLRDALPATRLVVYGGTANPAWRAGAWAEGADEILTNRDGTLELLAAMKTPISEPVPLPW